MKLLKHFDFLNQEELDFNDWSIVTGDKWHNNEMQIYTNHTINVKFENGLVIQATKNDKNYFSGRLSTKGKFSFKYGRLEAIFKVPKGRGTWPAIWMMPVDNKYGDWPKSGEIDIMEHTGNKLDNPFFCLHTEKYNHTTKEEYHKEIEIDNFSDSFQKITLDWEKDKITYLLNDEHIVTYNKGQNGLDENHEGWPFDQEFYLILNLAIGGTFGGEIDDNMFPQKFIIRDIKVYSKGEKENG